MINWDRVVQRALEKEDFKTALQYINQILGESSASERYAVRKLEVMLKDS